MLQTGAAERLERHGQNLPRPCRRPSFTWGGRHNLHNGEYREASTRDAPPERHNPGRIYEVRE